MVTAILLLLSLPVLAGKHLSLPALSLAVCENYSQCAMMYTFIVPLKLNDSQVTSQNFMSVRNFNDCTPKLSTNSSLTSSNPHFASYLAGLIEGDGTIIVPTTERSPKGRLNFAAIQLAFAEKDYPLAAHLQSVIGHGSLSKRKTQHAYIYTVNNYDGLVKVASLINGLLRTPKMVAFTRLVNYLNLRIPELDMTVLPLDTSPLSSNA